MERIRVFVVAGDNAQESLAVTVALERALSAAGIAVVTSRSDTPAIEMRKLSQEEILATAGPVEIGDA
jgi:hypothetical protein